jgi:DNA polymerase I-like protein with 3'-5' exonuclease and polymerase domains
MGGVLMAEFPNSELVLSRSEVALDVETTGLSWFKNKMFALSLSWYSDAGVVESWYGDIREPGVLRWVRDHVPRMRKIVNHYIKFDAHFCRETNIILPQQLECTMIRETILDENLYDYSLDALSLKYLNRKKEDIWPELANIFGGKPTKDVQILNLPRAPTDLVARYANVDTANALQIWKAQKDQIDREGLHPINDLEHELLHAVIDMERGGVRVDLPRAERSVRDLEDLITESQLKLNYIAGSSVNVNSAPQVKKLLGVHKDEYGNWFTGDGVRLEPTDSGNSGSLKTEKLYQSKLPAAAYVADIRAMIKAKDTFLKKYILTMSHKGYIHASINQTRTEEGDGTYTGRFSITEPALQQIHKRNKRMAAVVRACFIPDEGSEWGCYDWSQKDFRVFAHYVDDPKINAVYAADPRADFHRITANITGLPRDRDQKTGGANAKQMNLGLIFGMSPGRMAKEMFLPYTLNEKGYYVAGPEAEELFNQYHSNIPGANRLKRSVSSVARSRGYIKTLLGRRLRFPDANEAYKAAGILFQGQAAESMKVKICELYQYQKAYPELGRLMLVVHDEYDYSLRQGRDPKHEAEIKHILERFDGTGKYPLKYRIPILSDYGVGENWYEASK